MSADDWLVLGDRAVLWSCVGIAVLFVCGVIG